MGKITMIKYIPILISILSLVLSCISLGWNIYRDLILKARLKVRFYIANVVMQGHHNNNTYIALTAINFGPGEVICNTVCFKNRPNFVLSKKEYTQGMIVHDYTNPLSAKLPNKLKVGETLQLLFQYDKDVFLKEKITHIGIVDSFGREHYASRHDVKKTKKKFTEDFYR